MHVFQPPKLLPSRLGQQLLLISFKTFFKQYFQELYFDFDFVITYELLISLFSLIII